jgi:hypothetical protein
VTIYHDEYNGRSELMLHLFYNISKGCVSAVAEEENRSMEGYHKKDKRNTGSNWA